MLTNYQDRQSKDESQRTTVYMRARIVHMKAKNNFCTFNSGEQSHVSGGRTNWETPSTLEHEMTNQLRTAGPGPKRREHDLSDAALVDRRQVKSVTVHGAPCIQ